MKTPMTKIQSLFLGAFLFSTAYPQSIDRHVRGFLSTLPKPESPADFKIVPHLPPQNQDTTLICWSFATSSFIESEMERLGRPPVRLSVVYPLYCIFQEKARRFIATKGASRFAPGDLFTGVLDVYKTYGAMPAAVYGNKVQGESTLNHHALYAELHQLMNRVKEQKMWDEVRVLTQVREILQKHLGVPPAHFQHKGRDFTPLTFLQEGAALPWKDYVIVTSFQYAPFYQFVELKVPDNWQHQEVYYNVPLDIFYRSIKQALGRGFSVAFDADITEPSYELTKRYAFVPPFDLPMSAISPEARELRFNNGATTDDHLMHFVSYGEFGGEEWFLVKDSWQTAFEGSGNGYMFFHGSYVQLKTLAFLVHRDALTGVTDLPENK